MAAPPRSIIVRFFEQLGEPVPPGRPDLPELFQKPWEGRSSFSNWRKSAPDASRRLLTAAFGGLVFGLQSYYGFHKYIGQGSEAYGGPIIAVGLVRELIPILVGLMVAGRVGSSMAAEIGTMRITEQIDALFTLGADSVRYLVAPARRPLS